MPERMHQTSHGSKYSSLRCREAQPAFAFHSMEFEYDMIAFVAHEYDVITASLWSR